MLDEAAAAREEAPLALALVVELLDGRWIEVEVDADVGPGGGLGRRVVVAEEAMFWPAGMSWSAEVWTEL
jgi:hypothetical protein